MESFFKSLSQLAVTLILILVGCGLVHSALPPSEITMSTIEVDPNASMAARTFAAVGLAMADKQVTDHVIFKTAEVKLGDQHWKLVGLPGMKWMRYE